jgi:PEP-CTERM motif
MWNRIVRLAVLFAVPIVGAGELQAGGMVVTRVDGTIGTWTLTSPNPNNANQAVLLFQMVTPTKFNGQAVPDGTTGNITQFFINLTPVAGPAGNTTFGVGNPGLSGVYQTQLITANGTASFGLFGNSATPPAFQPNAILIPNNATNTLTVTTTGTYRGNGNPNYDFTKITSFQLNLTAANNMGQPVNLATIIQKGGTATGTGTFILSAVPEPSSVVLLALGTLGLARVASRRPRR